MAPYLGDYAENATVDFKWNTNDSDGASITRSTDGAIWVYKDDADGTEVQTGVTDTEDFDSVTGVHHCKIILTDGFYATGSDYTVVLKTATIDTQTVNAVLASFSIENRYTRGTDSAALAATALTDATWTDAAAQALIDWINGGRLDLLLDAIPTTAMRGTDSANTTVPDAAGTAATLIGNLNDFDPANDDVAVVTTTTTNSDMRGTDSSNTTVPDGAGTAAALHGVTDGKVDSIQTDTTAIKAKTDNLPSGVAKNVALSNFTFYMTDSTDDVTAKTGLTITSTISKDGGAYNATSNSATEISNGAYKIDLIQAEMNADVLSLIFVAAGANQRVITILPT